MTTMSPACESTPPARRATVDVDGVRLSYLEWGSDGPPMLLLHGITSSARGWWQAGPALAARGFHVYALDLPGHGASAATDDHRIPAIAGLVGGAMQALGIHDAVVIGHSWGGATALALATAVPNRPAIQRVVLIDPALGMTPERGEQALPNFMRGVSEPVEANQQWVRAANPGWHQCDVDWKLEALAQCRPDAVRGLFLHSGSWYIASAVADVDVPLLLLVADPAFTVVSPDALADAERAFRPGLGFAIVVMGTDHNMLRAGYSKTMPVLLDWLQATA